MGKRDNHDDSTPRQVSMAAASMVKGVCDPGRCTASEVSQRVSINQYEAVQAESRSTWHFKWAIWRCIAQGLPGTGTDAQHKQNGYQRKNNFTIDVYSASAATTTLFQTLGTICNPFETAAYCLVSRPRQQAAHSPGHAEDHPPHQAVVMPHPVLPSHRARPGMGRAQAPYGRLQTATGCCCCCCCWGGS